MSNKILKNWKAYKLESFSIINPSVKLITGNKYPFVAMESVEPNKRYLNNIPLKKFKGSGARFKARDTIFARITPCLQNGKIAQFNLLNGKVGFGSTEYIVFRDIKSMSDPNYLYYLLQTYEIRKHAENSMAGASGRQRTDLNYVKQIKFLAPPIKTQKKIASTLSTYDELIENNRKRIEILEEMAQLLYREWFVEFRFPGHQKTKLVNSPLGKIPTDWRITKLKSFCEFISRGITPKYLNGSKKLVINQKSNKGIRLDEKQLKELDPNLTVPENKRAKYFDILLNSLGEGTIGRIHLFTKPHNKWAVDQHMTIIRSTDLSKTLFTYLNLASYEGQAVLKSIKTGGTNMTMLKISDIRKYKFILPNKKLRIKFFNLVESMFQEKEFLKKQNIDLVKTRDLLLPKLMSGEIKV